MSEALLPVAILAGGLATRMRPLTVQIPKSMLEVEGEPFIDHQLRLLRQNGGRRVVLCLGHLGEMVEEHVGRGERFGLEIACSYDGERPLGTGGALRKAARLLGEAFFVMYGDSYLETDYLEVQRVFEASGKSGLLTVFRNEELWDTSNVEFADGRILAYDKSVRTPAMQYIDYGLGMLKRDVLDWMAGQEAFELTSLYQLLLKRDELAAYEVPERFYEIGSKKGLEETRNRIRSRGVR